MFDKKSKVDTGYSLKKKEELVAPRTPNPEEISLSLFENGLDLDSSFIDKYVRAKEHIQVHGNAMVDQARTKARQRKVDEKMAELEGTIETPDDLQKANEEVMKVSELGLEVPSTWLAERGKENLRRQSLMKSVEAAQTGDPEAVEALQRRIDFEKDLEEGIIIQQEIEKLEWMTAQEWDKASVTDLILDGLSSISVPLSDVVKTQNRLEDIMVGHSTSGLVFTTQFVNQLDEVFKKATREEKLEMFRRIPEIVFKSNSQISLGNTMRPEQENVLLNTWIASLITNTLRETREDGDGILGIKTTGDVGVMAFDLLEAMAAGDLAFLFGRLTRKLFSTPAAQPTMWRTTQQLERLAYEAGVGKDMVVVQKPTTGSSTLRAGQGSLWDVQKQTDPESLGKMIEGANPEEVGMAFEAMGIDRGKFMQRWMPQIDDTLDPTALPPSAYMPEMANFMRTLQKNNNLTLLGYEADRSRIANEFASDFISVMQGYPHYSRSFMRPAEDFDSESLGTWVSMFGRDPDKGFTDPREALELANNLKGAGHAAKIVPTDDGFFVQVEKSHVLTIKDARPWNSVTGQRLTNWFGRGNIGRAINPSSYTINIAESLHPQRLASYGVDSGAALAKAAADVLESYTRLKASGSTGGKVMGEAVDEALMLSANENRTLSESELLTKFPEIGLAGIEAYNSNRLFWEAMRFVRSRTYRRDLASKGYKTMAIGDWGFYGKVLSKKPKRSDVPTGKEGNIAYNDKMETNNTIYGRTVYDPIGKTDVQITNEMLEDLYNSGGRIVQLRQLLTVGEEDFSHIIVRDLNRVQVAELSPYVNFGLEHYGGGVRYKDVQYKLVWTNSPARINGQDVFRRETVGVVQSKAEANRWVKWNNEKYPDRTVVLERSREMNDALGLHTGGETYQTYMRHRGKERPLGKIDKDGVPTPAILEDADISFAQDMWSLKSENLRSALELNEARFVKEFGQWFKEGFAGFYPTGKLGNLWDSAKMDRHLSASQQRQVKKDAQQIQWYINTLRNQMLDDAEKEFRADIAHFGRLAGASDNVVAQATSKALINLSKSHPSAQIRAAASSLYIAAAPLFQIPQNLLNAAGIISAQGIKGFDAITDMGWIANAHLSKMVAGHREAGIDALAWKLGVSSDIAEDFMDRLVTSGVFGNAGEVDNLISYISEMTLHSTQAGGNLRKYTTRLPSTVVRGMSNAVSKSIDVSMIWYWSAAFRKQVAEYTKNGMKKKIGSDDFWEQVRQRSRRMSLNQNSSDVLSLEKRANALSATAFQFIQYILKMGMETLRFVGKAVSPKVQSAWAETQWEAIRGLGLLTLAFGGGGMLGREGLVWTQDALPDSIVNPQTDLDEMILATVTGGWIDAMLHAMTGGLGDDDQVIPYSTRLGAGAITDQVVSMARIIEHAFKTGRMDVEVLSTFGGAGWSASKSIVGVLGLYPTLTEQTYDTDEKIEKALVTVGSLSKSFSDSHQAWVAYNTGKLFAKTTGSYQGEIKGRELVAKAFGFDTRDVHARQIQSVKDFFDKKYIEHLAKSTVNELRKLANDTIVRYVRDEDLTDAEFDTKFIEFQEHMNEKLNAMVTLGLPKESVGMYRNYVMQHWSLAIAEDSELTNLGIRLMQRGADPKELMRRYARQNGTDSENYQQLHETMKLIFGENYLEDEE